MALRAFRDTPRSLAPRELLALRDKLGGKVGLLVVGGQSIPAIQAREDVFATLAPVLPKFFEQLLNMTGADLHPIKNGADAELLKQRLEHG